MAPSPGSAAGEGSMSARDGARPAMELKLGASFDAEAFLAGADMDPTASDEQEHTAESDDTTLQTDTDLDTDEEPLTPDEDQAEDSATDEPEDAELLEALKPKAVKRFNKLLQQRDAALAEAREAKRERDELQTRLTTEAETPVPVSKADEPLAAVVNEEQLEAYETHYKQIQRWCRRYPQGGTPPPHLTGGQELDLDSEATMDNLETAEAVLEAIPKRRDFLGQYKQQNAEARKALPELFVKGTPENKAAQAWHRKLLNFHAQADQTVILAKLVKLERMEAEERDGVAKYPRVPLDKTANGKPAMKAATTVKPAALSKAVPAVRPSLGTGSPARMTERLNKPGESIDAEDLLNAL